MARVAAAAGQDGDAVSAAVRAQAWLGDAALDFILALLGSRAGLSAQQMDTLSQQRLSNEALALLAPEDLASVALTATGVEADVGASVAPLADQLLAILLPALYDANALLADALQDLDADRTAVDGI